MSEISQTWEAGSRFTVVGDLQRTSMLEIWRRQNDRERELLVARIAEERPDFLLSLGDMVFAGASSRHWARSDRLLAPVRDAGIQILPILGNHELWGVREKALTNYHARFPDQQGRRWYDLRYGPVGLVLLDSNVGEMTSGEWEGQKLWLEERLHGLDLDPAVLGVLVFVHHPPFTNSSVTGDEAHVERHLVPAFLAARKTQAMVSGHVHSYERFVRAGRAFLVSGGGGGPRAKLLQGERRRHPDDLFDGPSLRDFHYLSMEPGKQGIEVVVTGLPEGGSAFYEMDRFTLPWR